jgi:glycosyltransferase involved in cell wall biosynthesis
MSAASDRRLLMIEQGGRGGVTDYTVELLRGLAAEGWSITLASADDHLYPSIPGVVIEPIFHYLRETSPIGRVLRRWRLGRLVNGVRFMFSVAALMRLSRRAEVVHTQGWELLELGLVAILGLRLAGATVIQTSHSTFDRYGRFTNARRLIREVTGRLTVATIVHTEADLDRLPPAVRAKALVIPHGEYGGLARTGGEADRDSSRAALGIDADVPVTLLFGQLRADKGLGDLLQALQRLPALHLLVGGEDVGALAEVADQLQSPQLAGRTTVREGFLEMSEAAQLFAAADTVALPYPTASQSGVLLLAYGFHRPVIVYPVGGLPESVIDGETGWICARADVDALVGALGASIDAGAAECRRRGEAGARLADERFAWPAIAHRTSDLYLDVLARV